MRCFRLYLIKRLRGNCDGCSTCRKFHREGQSFVKDRAREQIAAEVVELGEMLFDTVLEAAGQPSSEGEAFDASLREGMQAAAEEYFMALRLLLRIEQPTVSHTTTTSGDASL